jgi:two-component system nitrate/nitrite response regulator NarL
METQGASTTVGSEPHALRGSELQHPRPTVFIISDVRLYREGLSWSLTHEGSLEVLGASGPSTLTFESLEGQAPDAIVFDITIRDGLQLARELHARLPHAKIVAFAVSDIDGEIVTGAMAGISGYVHCDGSIGDLVMEVHNAVRGELHCSPRLAARLLQQVASLSLAGGKAASALDDAGGGARALTRRESEILGLVERGLSNKEIARALSISFATVKNHVHHILDKLHVRRRTQVLARLRERRTQRCP